MRNKFDEQLEELHIAMIQMGGLCEEAISKATDALADNNKSLIEEVFAADAHIDKKESEIESFCMKLLLQQQPVAGDLRTISSALKMISDMERIGDQASDIAEIAKYIINQPYDGRQDIRQMAKEAIKMVTDSIDSFVKSDAELADKVIQYDDIVDEWFRKIKSELILMISKDNSLGEYYIDLLMVAKYLERIGDHATNIAEWVEYSVTGKRKNSEENVESN